MAIMAGGITIDIRSWKKQSAYDAKEVSGSVIVMKRRTKTPGNWGQYGMMTG